jgi:4-amino-4-deoxy-L-arabinose transferase-like glycosyltransferase
MNRTARTALTAAGLAAAALILYVARLESAPIYASPDEVIIAVDAHSLATTGRDVYGRFMPLYFQIQMPGETRMGWFFPAIFYVSALFLKILPVSEWTIRLSTVCVGTIDVVLMYFIGRRLFKEERLAVAASLLLAVTPGHFILSRYALDYVYPLPFVLAWLLCLLVFMADERPILLYAAAGLLGLGFFSYIGSVVMMPMYFAITCAVALQKRHGFRLCVIAAVAFALPLLLLLVPWLVRHPTAFTDTVQRYELYDTQRLNALQGMRAFFSYTNLDRLASLYWSFYNPSFLFFSGDRLMTFSTRSIGVFALPMAVLLLLGLYQVCVRLRSFPGFVVLAGFVTAPVAALLGGEDAVIIRAVELLPFTVLLATFGLEYLLSQHISNRASTWLLPTGTAALVAAVLYGTWMLVTASRLGSSTIALGVAGAAMVGVGARASRMNLGLVAAAVLLAMVAVQFGYFAKDYFGDYRVRSSAWLGGNLRGALEALIDLDARVHPAGIYFSTLQSSGGLMDTRNRWMDAYWKFYLIKHGRQELLNRSGQFNQTDLSKIASGSLVLANVGDLTTESLVASGQLRQLRLIPEVDGPPFFAILQR